ncbi:uncharacterized protein LOC144581169 [Callithrix jacchus]
MTPSGDRSLNYSYNIASKKGGRERLWPKPTLQSFLELCVEKRAFQVFPGILVGSRPSLRLFSLVRKHCWGTSAVIWSFYSDTGKTVFYGVSNEDRVQMKKREKSHALDPHTRPITTYRTLNQDFICTIGYFKVGGVVECVSTRAQYYKHLKLLSFKS